ncbi:MAG: CarD family transcriptional regulator [Lachnospiraceae bacterium]|nr:CarD family transcriptional regulator [Lachnospira sp.]MBQ8731075.1 CarD family transcriptional regulator [Lachnospiraceae bacterium]MBR6696724.1 CarD family transcriptional regulator [Lachnospiraceae bacterium]
MFNVGEYVIYGSQGVCRVESIGPLELSGISKDKQYYTLSPIYQAESKVYAPVDNNKVVMRHILTKSEVEALIGRICDIDTIIVANDRLRETVYKEALHTCNCEDLIKVIKTIYIRKQDRIREGKKSTNSDERYLKLAESALYGEFALVLDMKRDEVESYITSSVNNN